VKVKLFPPLINYALCHEDVWESGVIGPPFFMYWQTTNKQNYHRRVLKFFSVLKSGNNIIKINGSIRYTITAKYVEEFLGCTEKYPVYGFIQTRF
jgi:hypothetical protein